MLDFMHRIQHEISYMNVTFVSLLKVLYQQKMLWHVDRLSPAEHSRAVSCQYARWYARVDLPEEGFTRFWWLLGVNLQPQSRCHQIYMADRCARLRICVMISFYFGRSWHVWEEIGEWELTLNGGGVNYWWDTPVELRSRATRRFVC